MQNAFQPDRGREAEGMVLGAALSVLIGYSDFWIARHGFYGLLLPALSSIDLKVQGGLGPFRLL